MTMKKDYSPGHRFFGFGKDLTAEALAAELRSVKECGVHGIVAGYKGNRMEPTRFDSTYFAALDRLVQACHAEDVTFLLEDYAPFPTGSADGAYASSEYKELNKLYVDERHIDFVGPQRAVIRVEDLMKANYGIMRMRFNEIDPSARKMLGIVAVRLRENPDDASCPYLEEETAIRLDQSVTDGFLYYEVPEGLWRIFVLYTTRESSGRPHFMNLLSKDSVALEISKVHLPVYEHLKEEAGKTWLGFFYDEPEIGNDGGADVFDFFMLPGRRSQDPCDVNVYSWSPEMPGELSERDPDWILHLPGLFYDGGEITKDFRCSYMDSVSKLVRENYNGQVYQFCQEHGLLYIGHVLEDENCHTRLGCGPGHYFRQQHYQDEAGIDVIAGQVMPGKDRTVSWYGVMNADGEFYHYGLAKLASSEAHINPIKKNRAFAEVFAMYGQMGLSERKFLLDHLMVNGVNRMLYADLPSYQASPEYSALLAAYTDRICSLIRSAKPVIKTAVLYHAEAEWREGKSAQKFQKIGAKFARRQISYDIIPSDVFSDPERYHTVTDEGLVINGNSYDAFVVPASEKQQEAVRAFIEKADKNGFPVFFAGKTEEALSALAEEVSGRISMDLEVCSEKREWIRAAHYVTEEGDWYLLHNEAPQGELEAEIRIPGEKKVLLWDAMTDEKEEAVSVTDNGWTTLKMDFAQWEMKLLLIAEKQDVLPCMKELTLPDEKVTLKVYGDDGLEISGTLLRLPQAERLVRQGTYTRLEYSMMMDSRKCRPDRIDLGTVSDCAELFVNGTSAGKRPGAPYAFDVRNLWRDGLNEVRIEVFTSASNIRVPVKILNIPLDTLTAVPFTPVLPMGIRGPVRFLGEA